MFNHDKACKRIYHLIHRIFDLFLSKDDSIDPIDRSTFFLVKVLDYLPPINGKEIVRFNCFRWNAVTDDSGHGEV